MPKYTKDDKYICDVCGKEVQKYNKWHHNKVRYHKLLKFCKEKINKIILDSQIKYAANIYEQENNRPEEK